MHKWYHYERRMITDRVYSYAEEVAILEVGARRQLVGVAQSWHSDRQSKQTTMDEKYDIIVLGTGLKVHINCLHVFWSREY